ncbi:hypothetical protein C1H46_013970 [Malus baccata]|uniref:Cation efflux protein cytoplasmic domain-containing protein n=1 Tax=Malus baccata TaxID=106549 RepID=A0A540MNY0_MALBA|nr:hypothetical protein C1H46_013970 [Malus baccata]
MEHEKVPFMRIESQEIEIPIVSEGIDDLPVPPQVPRSLCVCVFSKNEHCSLDSKQRSKSATKLSVLVVASLMFMVVEMIGGVKANSLAVLTDAAHLLTDVVGFSIALFTVLASGWKATSYQSFGYHRLEVLSALFSVQLIWLISGILIYEAVDRIVHTKEKSVGVMVAGGIIWARPDWLVVDLICTLIFSVFAVSTTISMLKNIYGILMERTPSEIDIAGLEKGIKRIKGVRDVHDLHVWALTVGKTVLSCHVTSEPAVSSIQIIDKIRDYCESTYRIHHVTIQIE